MSEQASTLDVTESKTKKKRGVIAIRVKDQSGVETFFHVLPNTMMQQIFVGYASTKGLPVRPLRFLSNGVRVRGDETIKMLELEDQDQIDVALQQTGGYRAV